MQYRVVRYIKGHWSYFGIRPKIEYSIRAVTKCEEECKEGVFWEKELNQYIKGSTLDELEGGTQKLLTAFEKPTLNLSVQSSFIKDDKKYCGVLSHLDKVVGCLIGCAAGDSYGVPFERRTRDEILPIIDEHINSGNYTHTEAMPSRDDLPWTPYKNKSQKWRENKGQYSDDTLLMKLVYEVVKENRGAFCPELYSQKLIEVRDHPIGFGKGTMESLERLSKGISWKKSGTPEPSAGNGAAMKAACFGVLFDNKEECFKACIEASLPTHRSDEAIAGAFTVASTAFHLNQLSLDEELKPACLLEKVIEDLEGHHEDTAQDLKELYKLIDDKKSKDNILEWIAEKFPPQGPWDRITPYVRPTVLWALTCFLLNDNFVDTLYWSLACGGDVDTTAAIACSLFGCYNGAHSIPVEFQRVGCHHDHETRASLLNLGRDTHEVIHDRKYNENE